MYANGRKNKYKWYAKANADAVQMKLQLYFANTLVLKRNVLINSINS